MKNKSQNSYLKLWADTWLVDRIRELETLIKYMKIILKKIKQYFLPLLWWLKGTTPYNDKDFVMIDVGDFVEAYDKTGKRWTAFIERRIKKGYSFDDFNIFGYTFIYVFASNYDTWLNGEYCDDLKIIKKRDKKYA